jgi:hypothetical protein
MTKRVLPTLGVWRVATFPYRCLCLRCSCLCRAAIAQKHGSTPEHQHRLYKANVIAITVIREKEMQTRHTSLVRLSISTFESAAHVIA